MSPDRDQQVPTRSESQPDLIAELGKCFDPVGTRPVPLAVTIGLRAASDRSRAVGYLEQRVLDHPGDHAAFMLLVQLLTWLDRKDEAETLLDRWLREKARFNLADLTTRIAACLNARPDEIHASYVSYPRSTLQNLGFWRHRRKDGKQSGSMLTKIAHEEHVGNEPVFYRTIVEANPELQSITPKCCAVTALPEVGLALITLEEINGSIVDTASLTVQETAALVDAYRAVARVPPSSVSGILNGPEQELGFSHGFLVSAMKNLDRRENLQRVDQWLRSALIERRYSPQISNEVIVALDALRECAFHERIDRDRHFGFLHGDLHRDNVIAGRDGPVFLDWARCAIGPKGIDLAVLLRRQGYRSVVHHATRSEVIDGNDRVSIALLAFALILVSVQIDLEAIRNEPPEHLFLPACEAIRSAAWK